MRLRRASWAGAAAAALTVAGGCRQEVLFHHAPGKPTSSVRNVALEIEYPQSCDAPNTTAIATLSPWTVSNSQVREYWDLTLEEALRTSLENSPTFRDLGGRLLATPQGTRTIYDPAIQETNPLFGVEAALSAFDANLNASMVWAKNDRPANFLIPLPDGTSAVAAVLEQDLGTFNAEVNKVSATGGQYFFRNFTNYEYNNNRSNRFPSSWATGYEAEFRQPLLQGAGIEFNRIAGPSSRQGYYAANGVMIARINVDIALADFEFGVRELVSNVENSYWDLYFAYRDLDAKIAARDSTLETWRRIRVLAEEGAIGGDPELEAQAREQYFRFQGQVEDALAGRRNGSTQTGGVNGAGVFGAINGGVFAREANLRFLMGVPVNDGRLIRPKDEPVKAKMEFQWESMLAEAMTRRLEVRRQKWVVKRRELELIAARNFLMPRLDFQSLYRWRGFGNDLWSTRDNGVQFDNAVGELFGGQYQEWQLGFTFNMPIGFRQAWAGVRNAEMTLARERSILSNQELSVSYELAASVREMDRAYHLAATNLNRRIASSQEVPVVRAALEAGRKGATLDVLLEAMRRAAEADSDYHRSLVEYTLAIKSVHFDKGTLLDYNGIFLTEGPWPGKAYADARELATRFTRRHINYGTNLPGRVSDGQFSQQVLNHGTLVAGQESIGPTPAPASPNQPQTPAAELLPPEAKPAEPAESAAKPEASAVPAPKPLIDGPVTPVPTAPAAPAPVAPPPPAAAPAPPAPTGGAPTPAIPVPPAAAPAAAARGLRGPVLPTEARDLREARERQATNPVPRLPLQRVPAGVPAKPAEDHGVRPVQYVQAGPAAADSARPDPFQSAPAPSGPQPSFRIRTVE